jgi:hypothetical protein
MLLTKVNNIKDPISTCALQSETGSRAIKRIGRNETVYLLKRAVPGA